MNGDCYVFKFLWLSVDENLAIKKGKLVALVGHKREKDVNLTLAGDKLRKRSEFSSCYLARVAGVRRGEKGERRSCEAQGDCGRGPFSLPRSF